MKKAPQGKKPKVLLLENINADAVKLLERSGFAVTSHSKAMSEAELVAALPGVSFLGIRSKTKVTEAALAVAQDLQAIGAFCIGTNQIDLPACTERGIAVFNAPYSNTRSVVELTLAEIVMLLRKTFDRSTDAHRGVWTKSSHGCYEVRGKKLGIVGYGNIGSQLSVLSEALGMRVGFYDIRERLALGNAEKFKSLDALLAWADIVTLHVDGRPENQDMMSRAQFAKMRAGSYFLNLSRGHVVDIDALASSLKRGHLAGASVDVFPSEPKGNDETFKTPLQGIPNVILTPHVGGSTEEAQYDIGQFVSGKLVDYRATGNTTLSVNFPAVQSQRQDGASRILHIHKNVPGMLAQINEILADRKINVVGQMLKTNERIGYVITDFEAKADPKLVDALQQIPHTISVRVC
jgi:D-3-phosphoglycerate dehydrogenase